VALAAADQLFAGPRLVAPLDVQIEESGAIRLQGGVVATEEACERALRGLLAALLLVARSPSPGLMRVGQRPTRGSVALLIQELEVALIPANRAAARRSLARLHRETRRAIEAGLDPRQVQGDVVTAAADSAPAPASPLERSALTEMLGVEKGTKADPAQLSLTPLSAAMATASRAPVTQLAEQAPSRAVPPPSLESDVASDVSVDVEFSPLSPPIAVPAEPAKSVVAAILASVVGKNGQGTAASNGCGADTAAAQFVAEFETPLEPCLRRYGARLLEPPEVPDIHKTPYLGTVAVQVGEAVSEAGWFRPSATGAEPVPVLVPKGSPGAAEEEEEETTEPMPLAVEWMDSNELEEDREVQAPTWPAPRPPSMAPVQPAPPRFAAPTSNVLDLLGRFCVEEAEPTTELQTSLKRLAGISMTPPPVCVTERAVEQVEATSNSSSSGPTEPALRGASGEPACAGGVHTARIISIAGS
jgi:hypothetical protein